LGALRLASQVNFDGIVPPALNSGLEIVRVCAEAMLLAATTLSAVRMNVRIRSG
jgi:hypothetical protein